MVDEIGYENLIEQAMLGVVQSILKKIAHEGLQGEHHFYISFLTHYPEVKMPTFLLQKYPKEMTIILQHQFWNLTVDDRGFSVELSFSVQQKLYIPFRALLSFSDPSVQFSLHFKTSLYPEETVNLQDTSAPKIPPLQQTSQATKVLDFSHFKQKNTQKEYNKDKKDD